MSADRPLGASFRDPSGFLFERGGELFRQVNPAYREEYDQLIASGLYQTLVEKNLLIPHEEVESPDGEAGMAYKLLRPEQVRFISYPYEWCFRQLKDAALATLEVQRQALRCQMSLKDASAYNIQFHRGRPILIDTLSFERFQEGQPWVAYRQFCQHFLAPLSLMALRDVRLGLLLRVHIDGIPLDLAARLLPRGSYLRFALLTHIHLHAAAQKRFAGQATAANPPGRTMSQTALLGLIDSLESGVRSLRWKPAGTAWSDYYESHHYSAEGLEQKGQILAGFLERIEPDLVWDLGANTGRFSRIASGRGCLTVSCDFDPAAVEINYRQSRKEKDLHLLPLWMDLTNPSPSLGWHHRERSSLLERGPADAVLGLALVHHLAISNNVPLPQLASFFAEAGRWLVVEFVPKQDAQVQRLLASRQDIFTSYDQENFERAFAERFTIHQAVPVRDSERIIYLMERRA
jgi:hypothetical protein